MREKKVMLTWSPLTDASEGPIPKDTLNHGAVGVTHGVWESSVSAGAFVEARASAARAPPEGPVAAAGTLPRSATATTASEQRAVLPQCIDTGRG